MKKCSKCDSELNEFTISKGHDCECRACFAAYKRNYRKDVTARTKDKARAIAATMQTRGVIIKAPCALCGDLDAEKHHPDYKHPKDIVWLCKSCHVEMHVLERRATLAA